MKLGRFLFLAGVLAVGLITAIWLARQNARMLEQLRRLPAVQGDVGRLREQNARAHAVLDASRQPGGGAAVQIKLQRGQAELGQLQGTAAGRKAKRQADLTALDSNRDPKSGQVRMENFSDHGRATPSDAFQTLVWAAMKGQEEVLRSVVTLSEADRAKAQAFLAGQPASSAPEVPRSPEDLAALAFGNFVTGHGSARIVAEKLSDPAHGTIAIQVGTVPAPVQFPVVFDGGGWRIRAPDGVVDQIPRMLGPSAKN